MSSLINYEPLMLLNRMREQLNRLYDSDLAPSLQDTEGGITSRWMPSVDVREEQDRFVFLADIPGVDPKDIEVTCEHGVLTIKGERKTESEEEREGYRRMERSRGSFYRRLNLPDSADAEHIRASSKHGVLELTIPKMEKARPRKITVKGDKNG